MAGVLTPASASTSTADGFVVDAQRVTVTSAGQIAATNVQAALEELDAEKAPTGNLEVPVSSADVVLTAAQFANNSFDITGTLTASINVIIPDGIAHSFIIDNATSGAFTVTVKHAATAGITITQGTRAFLYTNGTTVEGVDAVGGGGAVTSVFGRTGAVVATSGDYTAAQVGLGNVRNVDQVERTSATGSGVLPAGTTAQRDPSPLAGYTRFNTDTVLWEGHTGSAWVALSGRIPYNMFTNGLLDVWQMGAGAFTANGYTADGVYAVSSGSSHSVSRQAFTLGQTDVPHNPIYFLRNVVTSSAGAGNYSAKQFIIEGVSRSSGRDVTFYFYAKADTAKSIAIEGMQYFGTGGSPSSNVNTISVVQKNLTTGWALYSATITYPSVSGKTLGTNNDDWFGINVWMDAGSTYDARTGTLGQQSGTFDFALIQITDEATVSAFDVPTTRGPYGDDYVRCCRYYFEWSAANQGSGIRSSGGPYSTTQGSFNFAVPNDMRSAPATTGSNFSVTGWGTTPTALGSTRLDGRCFSAVATGSGFTADSNGLITLDLILDSRLAGGI